MKRVGAVLIAALLFSGCRSSVISCPPAAETTTAGAAAPAVTGGDTTGQTTTAPPTTAAGTSATTVAPVETIPTARELLGQTYGDFLALADGQCRLIHARGHTDVAFGLESAAMPHYELPESDAAFTDWARVAGLGGDADIPAELLRREQMITHIYVREGGQVTADLTVGSSVDAWRRQLPSLPDMTVLYDYTRTFNRGFYGRIETTVEGARAVLYIDLTTDRATQALAGQGMVLDSDSTDQWLGKTVSLPELPVGGVLLRLDQKG